MIATNTNIIQPRHIRLDVATACQLKCPACPTTTGETGKRLGVGFLRFDDFKRIVDQNPWVSHIELSNWGELFLNKDLLKIIKYAYKRNVALYAANGANLNTVKKEVLEALVKYKFRYLNCSIDGASQETYVQYRVNGHFEQVIENIKTINQWKANYRSVFPQLQWQFIAFGHNEHEIDKAKAMAKELNMDFHLKLSWGDLYTKEFSPVKDKELIRKDSGLGVATREEYRQKYGSTYIVERSCCVEMWHKPQINFDGRVLGCSVNYWGDYGNAFKVGLQITLNNETIRYARDMLMGKREPKAGIPCSTCKIYEFMKKNNDWLTEEETKVSHRSRRRYIMLENKAFGVKGTRRLARLVGYMRDPVTFAKKVARRVSALNPILKKAKGSLRSNIYPLSVPQMADPVAGWKPYPMFHGSTANMDFFSCHTSVLIPGHCPHLPQEHKDEEIVMMLSGQAELELPQLKANGGPQKVCLKAGQFVYYPAHFLHTLKAVGHEPANYLIFKWYAKALKKEKTLAFGQFDIFDAFKERKAEKGFVPHLLFESPTENLKKLHGHTSVLTPGSGYDAHIDPYDVAIIVLEGELETLGQRVGPHSVIFYAAGEPHGISNPGTVTAKYIVFEFHNK